MQFVKFRLEVVRQILREIGGRFNSALADQIQGAIDDINSQQVVATPTNLAANGQEVLIAVEQGKIHAVKAYHDRTGCGLLDAKNAIEGAVPAHLIGVVAQLDRLEANNAKLREDLRIARLYPKY